MKNVLLLFIIIPFIGLANLSVAKVFSDGVVIQRDAIVPIWGKAEAGETITVTFLENTFTSKTNQHGEWEVKLPKSKPGGPYKILIAGKTKVISINDVMIGDVWVCSGQSNMEWIVKDSNGAEEEIRSTSYKNIRHFKIPRSSALLPEMQLEGGQWRKAEDSAIANFTAVGYYFAKNLYKSYKIPIGLINSSWGGSRIEPWMSAEALGYEGPEEAANIISKMRRQRKEKLIQSLKQNLGKIPIEELGIKSNNFLWKEPDFDDSDWEEMKLPGQWEKQGLENLDGIVWFRKDFVLNKQQKGVTGKISLGPIDDSDQVWINGQKIGGLQNSWNVERVYEIPKGILKSGLNIISIRVEDTGQGGGIYGNPDLLFITTENTKIPLHGFWKFRVAKAVLVENGQANQTPTLLYNKMIHPILKFPIKGVIWYQGESNASSEDAYVYREQFKKLITDWRSNWNIGEFPFLFVQIANFMKPSQEPVKSDWAMLRESQSKALELQNTGQAVTIDIGDAKDIHPRNKKDVGKRLVAAAKKIAYQEDIVYTGPVFEKITLFENQAIVHFKNIGDRLVAKGSEEGELFEFTISGEDKKFVRANATIKGNTVKVWSDKVKNPVAVRYAWADNPDKANLFNEEGFPASPFRSDSWKE